MFHFDTQDWTYLLDDAADARYVATGHIVFMRRGVLTAVPFDPDRLEKRGQERPVRENLMQGFSTNTFLNNGAGQFSVSDTGWFICIYAKGGIIPQESNSLMWVDKKGAESPVTEKKRPYRFPRLSPDGQRIAYVSYGLEPQVWVYDPHSGTQVQLSGEGHAIYPIWTPNGKEVVFSCMTSRVLNLFSRPYDASLPMKPFTKTSEFLQRAGSWSPDGKKLALVESHPGRSADIVILDVDSKRLTPFLNSEFAENQPEFSPDSKWLAYTSDESNAEDHVYVTDFPSKVRKIPITSESGEQALWGEHGDQLFYRHEGQIWAVDIQTDGGFSISNRHLLFDKPAYYRGVSGQIRDYDLDPRSQRFLMVRFDQGTPTPVTEMILVQNWFEELKRLVPTGK